MIVLKLLWGFAALSLFPIKLLIGELLFSHYFTRCAHFKVRIAVSIVLQSVLSFGLYSTLSLTNSWLLSNTFFYFLEFGISVLLLKLLFRESYTELLSAAVASYMTEHTATQVFELLFGWTKAGLPQGDTLSLLLYASTQILLFVLTSLGVWLVFAKNAEPVSGSRELKRNMTLLSAATLIVVLFLSSVRDAFALESYALMVITRLFSIFCCLTLLYLRYSILDKSRAEHERAELERVVELERKQIEQSKENIELINIKCHDLRHRIDLWEQRGADVDAKEIGEVKRMIGFYDSAIHTGNDILDTILTERSLYCEKEGIRLSVIADGEKLGFLSAGDLCALFGNAIENAIEAVSKLSDPADRIISLQVRENRNMLVITVDNYYEGTLTLKDGLPDTTKSDVQNHGFGTKSIRRIAQKYGGEATITVDDMFHLAVIIPIPA